MPHRRTGPTTCAWPGSSTSTTAAADSRGRPTEPVTFVTPSYAADYERFVFQRESMVRCGIDLPHVVIVHDEDVGLFKSAPHRDGLTVLSSRDVLPAEIEGFRQTEYVSGWQAQQLTKLAVADVVDTDYVCVDSDTFWVRPPEVSDFRAPDGRLRLFEHDWFSPEMVHALAHSLELWAVGDVAITPVSWTNSIVPLARDLAQDLRIDIEALFGKPWYQVLLGYGATEYCMYGVYARYQRPGRVVPTATDLVVRYWKPEFEHFDRVAEKLVDDGKKAVMVHSLMGVPPDSYRTTVEPIWRELNS